MKNTFFSFAEVPMQEVAPRRVPSKRKGTRSILSSPSPSFPGGRGATTLIPTELEIGEGLRDRGKEDGNTGDAFNMVNV